MKKSETTEIVMMLLASYPAARTAEKTPEVYEAMLADLDYAIARRAVTRLIATSKWLPTIAEIREACTALSHGPLRAGGEAWQDAMSEVRRVGRYEAPRFADPLVVETMRLWGSWQGFCDSPQDDPGGRARFIELYDQLAARRRADVVSGIPLPAPRSASLSLSEPLPPRRAPPQVSAPAAELQALPPAPTFVPPTVKPRPVSAYAGRQMSAEEIQAAIDAPQEAAQ
jgi:hypothetical protein